jgi:AcrR family transcriptional regulator
MEKKANSPAEVHVVAPSKGRLTGAARRSAFLDAAAEIVLEKGPAAVTMDGVAARTGVAKRLGYRYFDNREELLKALTKRELDEAGERARSVLSSQPPLEEIVRVNITVWLQLVQERGPLLNRLLFGHDAASEIAAEVNARSTRTWTGVLRKSLDIPDRTSEILARICLAALRGAVEALEYRTASVDEIASIFTTVVLAGAKALVKQEEVEKRSRSR